MIYYIAMSIWIDQKYINLISARLPRFKQKNKDTYNFRCPICGDSERSSTKARGWIYTKGAALRFYCHNCSASMLIGNFIRTIDPLLYVEYQREKFIENNLHNPISEPVKDIKSFSPPKFMSNSSPLKSLKKVSSLAVDHPFKKYVMSRKIPSQHHYRLFYCEKFKTWVNSFIPDKFPNVAKDGPRLVLPLIDREKKFFGCQARSLDSKEVRYITVLQDESKPKVFGLDTCNLTKPFYVFEGPIDSLFMDNSIAMCGSDLSKSLDVNRDIATIIFDNEPRSKQIVSKIEKYINNNYRVCLWPGSVNGKDMNEMVLNGHEPEELKILIDKNTFRGLEAMLCLQTWRKC